MGKKWLILLGLFSLLAVSSPQAAAQSGYILTTFTCIPAGCEDQGPAATNSVASVSFDAQCSHGGSLFREMSGQVNIFVQNCSAPYVPFAKVESYRTTLLDECGSGYDVDTLREFGEVFDSFGTLVYSANQELSCDGGDTGTTIFGTRPC